MELIITSRGTTTFIYTELLDLSALGMPSICRASHVEPDERGRWWADLGPVNGPRLGPFNRRSDALTSELAWLREHLERLKEPLNLKGALDGHAEVHCDRRGGGVAADQLSGSAPRRHAAEAGEGRTHNRGAT